MGKRTNTAVWMEKQGRWQIKVQKNGERKCFTSATPGRAGQREANRKADAWLDDGICNTRVLIETVYPQWIEELKLTTSRSNWGPVESRWKVRVRPVIGKKRVEDLNDQLLQSIVNNCYAAGRAKKYMQNICGDLRAFCKYLRLRKMSTFYPEALHVPKGARASEKKILQPDALRVLLAVDTTLYRRERVPDPYINAYRFSAVTGLRPGELLDLQWKNIKNGMVQVHGSINIFGEVTRGKNGNAIRAFALTPTAELILEDQRKLTHGKGSVFAISSEGHYRDCWRRYCISNGLEYIPPYNLRHTFVSLAKTLPEGAVKSLVGHSRQMDTFGIYAHLVRGEEAQTAAALDQVLKKVLE